MKRSPLLISLIVVLPGTLLAQTTVISDIHQTYDAVKKNLLATADKVPESDYSFKPTPEVRSFGEVLGHVIGSQLRTCGAVSGSESQPASHPSGKAEMQAALKESFAACDKAFDSLTAANASETIKLPYGQKTKLGALAGVVNHDTEQYAILGVYMRLKGIVPPSSEHK